MRTTVVDGDLLDQDVEVIVNAWNRNIIPRWLLVPQGVSKAIRRRAGAGPFRELARLGAIPLGSAVLTGPGRLPHKAVIHVAGINLLWRSSEFSVRASTRSAVELAARHHFTSIAMPLIGAGTGGSRAERVLAWMLGELGALPAGPPIAEVRVVRYRPA